MMRFWEKVDRSGDCWMWTASTRRGYGGFWLDGRIQMAHRVSWTFRHGPIPDGMCVCHACDTPGCVNPDHLWMGTMSDNLKDAARKGRIKGGRERKTHCGRGHELSGNNVNGRRQCLACKKIHNAKRYARALTTEPQPTEGE